MFTNLLYVTCYQAFIFSSKKKKKAAGRRLCMSCRQQLFNHVLCYTQIRSPQNKGFSDHTCSARAQAARFESIACACSNTDLGKVLFYKTIFWD